MHQVRIESVAPGVASVPGRVDLALRLIARGQVMGFLPPQVADARELDDALLAALVRAVTDRGLVAGAPLRVAGGGDVDRALAAALQAVEASPQPSGEWAPVRELLGDELAGRLTGVSPSSLRRYAAGERPTPDEVAWRLHAVARMLSGLLGSYNAIGARRWFLRPRQGLGGRTPAEVVEQAAGEWDPALQAALDLADALLAPGSAA